MDITFMILMTTLGACMQGVAGMGSGLVLAPVFVWYFGSTNGIVAVNILGLVNSTSLAVTLRKDINWPVVGWFILAQTPAIAIIILLLNVLPTKILEITPGVLMLAMVAAAMSSFKLPRLYGKTPLFCLVALAGAFSTAMAQAGPAVTAYTRTARWSQREFSTSVQPVFVAMNLVVVPTKYLTGMTGVSEKLSWGIIGLLVLAVITGNFMSTVPRRTVKSSWVRNLAVFLGLVGIIPVLCRACFGSC